MDASTVAGRRLPESFRSLATLRILNVLAVGFSLAAATGAVFGRSSFGTTSFDDSLAGLTGPAFDGRLAGLTALPTLVFGALWALRSREKLGNGRVRSGWVASIPLAIANSATACGLFFWMNRGTAGGFLLGAVLGATVGVICWLPGLIATLVCFGLPITWSQELAKKGLAGEERGEVIVGVVSAVIAFVALAILVSTRGGTNTVTSKDELAAIGHSLIAVLALLGAATGSVAAVFAHRRENVRRAFVRNVEAGDVEGYRIDATAEGKVLVRITSMGEGYRVASFEEPIFGLDESGKAQRSMAIDPHGAHRK